MKSRNKTIRRVILLLVLVVCIGLAAARGGRLALHRFVLAEFPREYSEFVEPFAEEYGLDPLLIYAFIRTESGFDPAAQSNVDARGLMQITEETFDWI